MRRATTAVLLAVLSVASLAVGTPSAGAAAPWVRYHHYVALGDSYAAGPGIPAQTGTPAGCARSNHNYAALLASALRVPRFTDVTCSGAQTKDMTAPQPVSGGANPAQFDALTPDTDLVTLTISGNDIGFGEILGTCGRLAAADPTGNPCQRYYGASGHDQLADRVATVAAPRVRAVLAGIHQRAPHATVLVVGYLRILPTRTGCFPAVPFAAGDTPYFDGVERLLNRTIAGEARRAHDRFVDTYTFSYGHDACQPEGRRWVEGLVPQAPSAPMHPNATGMAVAAGLAFLGTLFPLHV